MTILSDVAAERAVLAGICRYGDSAYYDVVDFVQDSTFKEEINQAIFKCLKHIFDNNDNVKIDIPTLFSASQDLGLEHYFAKTNDAQHLQAILNLPIELSNVRRHAAKIRKLEIAGLLHQQLGLAQGQLLDITGNESIAQILGIAEDAVFNFTSLLNDGEDEPTRFGDGILDYVKYLENNPVDQVGISTGFPVYDNAIGGGLRGGTVNIIAARSKIGKSMLSANMGYHIVKNLNIPVLIMDTEMIKSDQTSRILAMMSGVSINQIETGKFGQSPEERDKVHNVSNELEKLSYFHKSIAGSSLEEQIGIIRRWLTKQVGLNDDGTAKQCIIIYDYLKLMNQTDISGNIQEYQALGFLISTLHNLAVRYNLPILALVQLNRDGISKESTDVISGSDRLLWLASNFTIFKNLSDEEIVEQGLNNGNTKLVPLAMRHGAGLEYGNYICCQRDGRIARITERKTRFEIDQQNNSKHSGESVDF